MRNVETGFLGDPVFHRRHPPVRGSRAEGFTLLEMLVVMTISTVMLAVVSQIYSAYLERSTALSSARTFARDLSRARANAVQVRDQVVVRFLETQMEYVVENALGRELVRRGFGEDDDLSLTAMDLQVDGDSLVFDGRGVLDMSGVGGTLGTASFTVRGSTATVSFNAVGATRLDGP